MMASESRKKAPCSSQAGGGWCHAGRIWPPTRSAPVSAITVTMVATQSGAGSASSSVKPTMSARAFATPAFRAWLTPCRAAKTYRIGMRAVRMKSSTSALVGSRELLSATITSHARPSGVSWRSRAFSVRRSDEARLKVGMTIEISGLDLIASRWLSFSIVARPPGIQAPPNDPQEISKTAKPPIEGNRRGRWIELRERAEPRVHAHEVTLEVAAQSGCLEVPLLAHALIARHHGGNVPLPAV